jgi:flagellar hook-associated protein 3 FlgL
MVYRVATNSGLARVRDDLARTYRRLSDTQNQVTSGKRLRKPSDDPSDVALALENRANQRRLDQYAANAADGQGWARVTDSTMSSMQEQLAQAKTKAVNAVNAGVGRSEMNALANDIDNVKASMIRLANSTYQGRPILGGNVPPSVVPYDANGVYSGDSGVVTRVVGESVKIPINVTGPEILGTRNTASPLSGDVFQVLDALSAAARSGNISAVGAAASAIDPAVDRLATAQVHVGGIEAQIDDAVSRNDLLSQDVQGRLSDIEDVDLAQAIISLKSDEVAYQAALGVTAKVIQPSLLDFLR